MADIIDADLGWVILFGFIIGIPTSIVAGPIFGKYIGNKIHVPVPDYMELDDDDKQDADTLPSFALLISIISIPLLLILGNTLTASFVEQGLIEARVYYKTIIFIGHPFIALTIAVLIALYALGVRRGSTREQLSKLSMEAMKPAGVIILITGAGGCFKQVLVDSGVGEMLANYHVRHWFTGHCPCLADCRSRSHHAGFSYRGDDYGSGHHLPDSDPV